MAASNRTDEAYFYNRQTNPPAGPTPPTPFGAPDRDTDPGKRIGRMSLSFRSGVEFDWEGQLLTKSWSLTPVSWLNGAVGLLREDNVWFTVGLDKWRKQKSDERGGSDGGLHRTYNVFDVLPPTETNQRLRQYEIVSNVIEGRRRAQGRSVMKDGYFSENVDIRTACWNRFADDSADPTPLDGLNGTDSTNPHFVHHRWHSGQFSGTIMEQSKFWTEVLASMGTQTRSPLEIKPLSEGTP